ncbi:MAG: hypothetical protein LVS60_01830 [Nodosilinea sp. LVE1205-7]|jgi:hypothetical protein
MGSISIGVRGLAIIAGLTTMAGALSPELQPPLVAPHGSAFQAIPEFQQSLVWAELEWPSQRSALLQAINHSLTYLASPKAAVDYQNPAIPGLSRDSPLAQPATLTGPGANQP